MADAVDHRSRGHARFGASSAHRWFACPGSVSLCDMVEKRAAGTAADEGTRAHELLELTLKCNRDPAKWGDPRKVLSHYGSDMIDAVTVAVDYVEGILREHPDAVLLVEHPFEVPVAAAPGEVWGTCDVVVFVPSLCVLHVVDYKHGAGVYVPVEGNKQLRFYGLGALASLTPQEGKWASEVWGAQFDTVVLTIVQPRCPRGEPVREEWLPVEDVLEFGRELGAAVAAAKAPGAPLVPGEEQCRFCPAKAACPALEARAVAITGAAFADVRAVGLPEPAGVADDRLAEVLAAKAMVVDWLNAVEAEAARRLGDGRAVPGFKLVEAGARRQWEEEGENAARKLCDIAGKSHILSHTFLTTKLRTLAEVEAILKRGVDKAEARRRLDAMAFLTTKKSSGKLTVAPESDPRPAANRAGAAFEGVALVETRKCG